MSSNDSGQEPATRSSHDATASLPSFRRRLFRRVKYMVVGCCFCGIYLGVRIDGLSGAIIGLAAGVVIGLWVGLVLGGYAWFLESPLKGAVRVSGLVAATSSVASLISLWDKQVSIEGALIAVIVIGVVGVGVGAPLGAFLGWLAGPIIRELVQEADRGDSPLKRRSIW